MRKLALLSIVLASSALLGCGGKQEVVRAACPSGQVCMEFGLGAEPESIDPHKIGAHWEQQVVGDMMIGLVDSDIVGEPIPGMATHWEVSADGLTWTFHLREAKWSDGVPVTADDFVFSLRRLLAPDTAAEYAALLYPVKNAKAVNEGKAPPEALGVRAVNPRTVEYTLDHPAPYFVELAKHQTMFPVPKHSVEKFGDDWTKPGNYVANGPYKLVSWRLGDRVVLEKNPGYWDAAGVCIDRINYYPTEDRISGERQVIAGGLDTNTPLLSNRVAHLRKLMPEWTNTAPMLGTTYLVFNNKHPKFQDRRIREALAMAVDREFLVNKVRNMGEPAAYTFVPPGIANYSPTQGPYWATWPYEKRVAEAKRLLKEAGGYGPDKPLKFEFMHRGYDPTGTYAAVQADWKKIGVIVTLIGTETQIAYQSLETHAFEFSEAAWVADYNDAMNFLFLLREDSGPRNYGQYINPEFDALLDKADVEKDAVKRADYMRQAEAMIVRDVPVIPVNFYVSSNITNPRLTGLVENISDTHRSRYMCFTDAAKKPKVTLPGATPAPKS